MMTSQVIEQLKVGDRCFVVTGTGHSENWRRVRFERETPTRAVFVQRDGFASWTFMKKSGACVGQTGWHAPNLELSTEENTARAVTCWNRHKLERIKHDLGQLRGSPNAVTLIELAKLVETIRKEIEANE